MKTLTKEELNDILKKHKLWLIDEGGERADLSNANLSNADLSNAYLYNANLRGANLSNAYLYNAYLYNADLSDANLYNAYLYNAYLYNANLRGANLSNADLSNAYLSDAYLSDAYLSNANLSNANLSNAYLSNAKNVNYPLSCPEEGAFVGYKKAGGYIVKIKISEDAKRSSSTGRKCRCSKAEVMSITNLDGSDSGKTEVCSDYDNNFVYRVGTVIKVDDFCDNRWQECAPGIHFFITRKEAVNYTR